MDQLLLDAKRLACRLREHNGSADALISQANGLHCKLDAMKQVELSIWTFHIIVLQNKLRTCSHQAAM